MTNKRKLKYISYFLCLLIGIFYLVVTFNSIKINNETIINEHLLLIEERVNSNSGANIIKKPKEVTSDILLTLMSPEVLQTMIMTYGVEFCNNLTYLLITDPQDIDWLRLLFSNLKDSDFIRLMAIIHTMNDRQVKELIELLLQYNAIEASNIIKLFIKLDNNNLIFLLRDLDKGLLRQLIEMLLENNSYDILMIYDQHELKRLMERIKKDYWILLYMFEMKTDMHKLLPIIEVIPNDNLSQLVWFFKQLNKEEKKEFLELLIKMNPKHIVRALSMVYHERNLVDSSKSYYLQLKKRLGLEDATLVIEKSVNIASKVDKEHQQEGVDKLQQLRAVKIRRIVKQVDGNDFSGGVITGMVDDSSELPQKDFDNYSNILSGDAGFYHGSYRSFDKEVTQERKLEVIRKIYSGNVDRQVYFDFMNGKEPSYVPHYTELETFTKNPVEIIKK